MTNWGGDVRRRGTSPVITTDSKVATEKQELHPVGMNQHNSVKTMEKYS